MLKADNSTLARLAGPVQPIVQRAVGLFLQQAVAQLQCPIKSVIRHKEALELADSNGLLALLDSGIRLVIQLRAMDENGDLLELQVEAGGLRYYLSGKPIHAGELLELLLDDGRWVLGRYEWNL